VPKAWLSVLFVSPGQLAPKIRNPAASVRRELPADDLRSVARNQVDEAYEIKRMLPMNN
jgi:hypothetical protein